MLNFLTVLVGSSLGAGFNLYLTLLAIGLYSRLGAPAAGLSEIIAPFGSWWVMVPAGVLFVCEFVADKVPAFDNIWDVAHTVVRPVGAVFIALTLAEDYGTAAQVFSAIGGGGLAFSSHAIKAGTRALARLNPEPTTNAASSTALSLAEDVVAFIVVVTSMVSPWIALGILAVVLFLMAWFGPRMISLFFFATHATWSRIGAIFGKSPAREGPLQAVQPLLLSFAFKAAGDFEPLATSACYVKLSGLLNYRRGALIMKDDELLVVYRRFFMRRVRRLKLTDVSEVEHSQRWFRETIRVSTADDALFLFFVRSREGYVKDLKELLASMDVTVVDKTAKAKGAAPVLQPA